VRDDEAEDVEWLPLADALARLTHLNERVLVRAVEGSGLDLAPVPPGDER
jgi:hypothetical protein